MKYLIAYINDNSAYDAQWWAMESLMILEENMVIGNMVNRDFNNQVQNYGDTVMTRRPRDFKTYRMGPIGDTIVQQDAISDNVAIVLNQHLHTSFPVYDLEQTVALKNLVQVYMQPAMIALARDIDKILLGQVYQFLGNTAGHLGNLDATTAKQYILEADQVMTMNKAPEVGRNLIIGPASKAEILQLDTFTNANNVGDDGQAIRTGTIGQKLNFTFTPSQNTPYVTTTASNLGLAGAVNHAGGYNPGVTSLTVNSFTSALVTGGFITINGDDTPQQIANHTETSGNTTTIGISPGLKRGVANASIVQAYATTTTSGTYTAGYAKAITVASAAAVQYGQLVQLAGDTAVYSIIDFDPVGNTITLDRPLDNAWGTTGSVVGLGPTGSYNFGFYRNALTLVNRPLTLPKSNVNAAVMSYNGLSVRVVIAYDPNYQKDIVTIDTLFGVKVLDTRLGVVLLG